MTSLVTVEQQAAAVGVFVLWVDVAESSEEHARVIAHIALLNGSKYLDVICEYSDPEWDRFDSRIFVGFGRENCILSDSQGEDLPLLVSNAELALINRVMDPVAEREIERVRDRAIAEEVWEP